MPAILFVEDDATIAMGVEYSLKQDGFQVSLADRLEEARGLLKSSPFDLVLLDLGLPDGSGYDLMREAKHRQSLKGIALSGFGAEEDVRRSREAGFDYHMTKPVNFQDLRALLRQIGS